METRKENLSSMKLCRFCLSEDETVTSLYDRNRAPRNSIPLSLKILSCTSIEVFPSDGKLSYICNRCKFFMDISYEFKQMCRQADETVLQYIQSGTELNAIPWTSALQKLYRVATKSTPALAAMKTVVEGGATVQVTAHGFDSEEEDDENVYNVKIGDGTDEGPQNARVKVITASKQNKGKDKDSADMTDKEHSSTSDVTWPPRYVEYAPTDDVTTQYGRWPCNECDCTYPLQQLLVLHKKHKHRLRNVQCNQCDAKFFSTYDLATHQLRHASDDTSLKCVICDKAFQRLIQLKRHEKIVHSELAQLPCPSCPATFLSRDDLDTHKAKHNQPKERRFACDLCDKRFVDKTALHRHKTNLHEKAAFACKYCPERFSSVQKLTKHVRGHASDRAYPCKFCDKSFVKSHHYTRHLRLNHRETNRGCRGPFGQTNVDALYRCEQCEDAFGTQDELIYHSAIHATQNLICPLCQEKFDDVDAVTAHIKSHVNGTEFMCDLCELVFTTKEKLDNHINTAHEDELREEAQEDSSAEMDTEDYEDVGAMESKEEADHMLVDIKKDDFMVTEDHSEWAKPDNANSEESENEMREPELPTVDTLPMSMPDVGIATVEKPVTATPGGAVITKTTAVPIKSTEKVSTQTVSVLRKAEEVKLKAEEVKQKSEQLAESTSDKKVTRSESNNTGANDKSLKLLEKELQELKRTNTRTEAVKTPSKSLESLRSRRPQIHTSTPKTRAAIEEKKSQASTKSPALEKKQSEKRIVTKENKEPKETKDTKGNNVSVEKELKEKEVKEKEKETPKSVIKNGTPDKPPVEEGVRRSTRPSKIKDYAKMIRDSSHESNDEDDSEEEEEEEEMKPMEKPVEKKKPPPKANNKPPPKVTTPVVVRKRGRPRRDASTTPTPIKIKKEVLDEDEKDSNIDSKPKEAIPKEKAVEKSTVDEDPEKNTQPQTEAKPASGVIMSPSGQALKKVPIKALPPGIKPLPLPVSARQLAGGEVCEMQIGKKVVKVQKIVMTKAEVEAMAKRGLVEMKDGTMVLKQGIKLPSTDQASIKNLVAAELLKKESPTKLDKAAPTRCNLEDDSQ